MANIINLTCPSCGGKLQLSSDINRFSCGYCGNEQIVSHSMGVITIAPVIEGLRGIKSGVDKTASELAIVRLKGELEALKNQLDIEGAKHSSSLIVGSVIFGIIFLFTLYLGNGVAIIIIGGVTLLFIIGAIGLENGKQKLKTRNTQIQKAINQKYKEIEQHKKTIEQN